MIIYVYSKVDDAGKEMKQNGKILKVLLDIASPLVIYIASVRPLKY